ncbi:MAG: c-type cytochrome [Candidatus Binatia bacterium]
MGSGMWTVVWRAAMVAAVALGVGGPAGAAEPSGGPLYVRSCAPCHGPEGRGDGPDASLYVPAPRNLREGFLERYSTDDLVARIRDGRLLALILDPKALDARAKEVEVLVAYLDTLPDVEWRTVERGQEIYVDRCEICHGPFGRAPASLPPGVGRPPRDLSDPEFQRRTSDAEMAIVVRHGRKGMPAIPAMRGEADVRALGRFVRLLSPGHETYTRYCSACHGDDGRGPGDFAESPKRPTVVFDRAYLRAADPEVLRTKVWHMVADAKPAMPHLRHDVSERDARAIVAYLKRLR